MNKQRIYRALFICVISINITFGQNNYETTLVSNKVDLFSDNGILPIKLSYSIKDIKKKTNDSTYIKMDLLYMQDGSTYKPINVELRVRGNNRLKNCYFPPIKLKIKKSTAKNTVFEGHKKLKLVMPCLLQKDKNDNVIKEYIAYKLYEIISPFYFKVRLVDIVLDETKGKNIKTHQLKGFLIEDIKHVAKRLDGNVYTRRVHPLQQDAMTSVRHAFFQYMIGNTDFSQAYQHNVKLVFIDKKIIPAPYDFDMSGFVNCSYAVVSQIQNQKLNIESVRQRMYRGFKREDHIFQQIRKEYLDKKNEILDTLDKYELIFDAPKEFSTAKDYILSFFNVMTNDKKFNSKILKIARKK